MRCPRCKNGEVLLYSYQEHLVRYPASGNGSVDLKQPVDKVYLDTNRDVGRCRNCGTEFGYDEPTGRITTT